MYNWPLCADSFTVWDKIKLSKFLFTNRIWTQGDTVRSYEEKWEKMLDCYAIMVSSGSSANELIALRRKWELQQVEEWPRRNKVVFAVNSWISNCSTFINLSFEPIFCDVNKLNLNVTSNELKKILDKDVDHNIGTVFYTTLLGFMGDLDRCKEITEKHGAKFLMDNCESTFSKYTNNLRESDWLLKYTTCSTSTFYSHLTTTCEGGLIFCNNKHESDWYRMARNHGMTRGMDAKYRNLNVNKDFDFYIMGSNYRSTNINAYLGLLDLDRAIKFCNERLKIFFEFYNNLDCDKFNIFTHLQGQRDIDCIPLAIPIICKSRDQKIKVETWLEVKGIKTRPIIGGCLLAHTAFKQYGKAEDYSVALNAHNCGFYIGINKNVTIKMAKNLAKDLNKL